MPHSLISASVLGFDLVRRPGGGLVADILVAALEADRGELAALAGHREPVLPVLADHSAQISTDLDPEDVESLARTVTIGDAEGLARLVGEEVLGPGTVADGLPDRTRAAACAVITSAAVRAWEAAQRTQVGAAPGWVRSGRNPTAVPPPIALLVRRHPREYGGADRDLWRSLARRSVPPEQWTAAMHQAAWAAALTGRTRSAAVAQLRLVRHYRDAGFGLADTCDGVWSLWSGMVQGYVVADLLPETYRDALAGPVGTR